ncbi:MAG: glutathione S-transferase N-terminal domain-containing protein [Thalassobaculaceae bacterium]|nr:glutathione S-transferase N-terminal domain-containing protein [Thalassobaculaceae bacterium]
MKLYNSTNSPYGRKVRVVALELGVQGNIDLIDTNPRDADTGFWKLNPLAKIPLLELDDGRVIYDSPVICEYLIQQHGNGRLLETTGRDPWDIRVLAALADGAMDAGMLVRLEKTRPESEQSPTDMAKQMATAGRAVDRLQELLADRDDAADLGTIGAGCCVAWLMLRHPSVDWLGARPALARWYERFSARDSMQRTIPGLPLTWSGV